MIYFTKITTLNVLQRAAHERVWHDCLCQFCCSSIFARIKELFQNHDVGLARYTSNRSVHLWQCLHFVTWESLEKESWESSQMLDFAHIFMDFTCDTYYRFIIPIRVQNVHSLTIYTILYSVSVYSE